MLRHLLYAVPTAALVLGGTAALAQTAAPAPAPSTVAQAPLMTAPRPDDQTTTEPLTSPTGVGGAAPSLEVQKPAPAVGASPEGRSSADQAAGTPPVASLPPGSLDPQQAQAMVGSELRTRDGQPGGRILDFTMGGPDGGLDRVVLAPNRVMGLGSALVSVPVAALTHGPSGPMLDLDAADLADAPAFAYDGGRTLTRPGG